MNALRRQNSRPQQMFQWKMNAEDTRTACELVHQNEAKHKQAPQSEANVS